MFNSTSAFRFGGWGDSHASGDFDSQRGHISTTPDTGYKGSTFASSNTGKSVGGSGGASDTSAPVELPVIPVTLRVLENAAAKGGVAGGKVQVHDVKECGVVSVVGWICESWKIRNSAEVEFTLADGTTSTPLSVIVDIRTEIEKWIMPKIEATLVEGSRVRIVGHPHKANNTLRIRATHFRLASEEEFAYYHIIETVKVYSTITSALRDGVDTVTVSQDKSHQNISSQSDTLFIDSEAVTPQPSKNEDLTLPDTFDDITDYTQKLIVRYVLDEGQEEIGAARQAIVDALRIKGYYATAVNEAIHQLESDGNIYPTLDGYFDVLRI